MIGRVHLCSFHSSRTAWLSTYRRRRNQFSSAKSKTRLQPWMISKKSRREASLKSQLRFGNASTLWRGSSFSLSHQICTSKFESSSKILLNNCQSTSFWVWVALSHQLATSWSMSFYQFWCQFSLEIMPTHQLCSKSCLSLTAAYSLGEYVSSASMINVSWTCPGFSTSLKK